MSFSEPISPLVEEATPFPGGTVRIPIGWSFERDVAPMLMVAFDPGGEDVAANITIVRESLPDAGSGDQDDLALLLRGLETELTGHRLIDIEEVSIDGGPGMRLLSLHHATGPALALEQWVRRTEESTLILSATCSALDRDLHAEAFTAIAASLQIDAQR